MFADDVVGLFVGAQPKKDKMAHLAFTRPFGEFNFAHKLRNEPRGRVLLLHLLIERRVDVLCFVFSRTRGAAERRRPSYGIIGIEGGAIDPPEGSRVDVL